MFVDFCQTDQPRLWHTRVCEAETLVFGHIMSNMALKLWQRSDCDC